ncbi:TIR domain-containing protein [Longimicrobium sp.]|uniref:TIR domain-containing protein n=1 Tax=Longimicrobium sp. TaxID=2029185 RepID=UPI002E34A87A|nr:TIR domain-containing protein [Longimicrobium sp.]HEX6037985.1 TIR domain-containing protein [Longimicrobium sp.]
MDRLPRQCGSEAKRTTDRDTTLHNFTTLNMPARIEYRLGSIFDEACDLLVIPMSSSGTVTTSMAEQLRREVVPLPPQDVARHQTVWFQLPHPKYRFVTYAASVVGLSSTPEVIEQIGRVVGKLAFTHQLVRVSAPLLGTGAGKLPAPVAAQALAAGFRETAPNAAVLTIHVTSPTILASLPDQKRGLKISDLLDREIGTGTPKPAPPAPAPAESVKRGITISDLLGRTTEPGARTSAVPESSRPRSASRAPASAPQPASTHRAAPVAEASPKQKRVFISYSRKDKVWLERLQPHLAQLQRTSLLWSDRDIQPGADWHDEITEQLNSADVALLLVSANFLASRFILEKELPPLLDAADKKGTIILPVIVSTCRFDLIPELSRFKAVNDPNEPLMKFRGNRLQAELDRIARAVETALKR